MAEDQLITINVVHVSDLHISERLIERVDEQLHVPHRYGHDVRAFLALDRLLRDVEWDVLVISGDLTRVGADDSFVWVRNWIENRINIDDLKLGLNLKMNKERHAIVVPGNHDRFEGRLTQGSVELFNRQFDTIRAGTVKQLEVRGKKVNFHLFDSSFDGGGFAEGQVDEKSLEARRLTDEELDIAVMHHHFIQPPQHERAFATELTNATDVCGYLLATEFDAVLFGHTHKSYIDCLRVGLVAALIGRKKVRNRILRRVIPKWLLKKFEDDSPLSYRREQTSNGQFPTMDSYLRFRLLRRSFGSAVKGPSEFKSIRQFYDHLAQWDTPSSAATEPPATLSELVKALRSRRILISMAPSACQAEADRLGVHRLRFTFADSRLRTAGWEVFEFREGGFELLEEKTRTVELASPTL